MAAVTVADVVEWGSLDTGSVAATGALQRVLDATVDYISKRYDLLPSNPAMWDADAQLAVMMQAARFWKRRRSPEGVAGFGDLGVVRISRIDPDVAELLDDYRVPKIGAG